MSLISRETIMPLLVNSLTDSKIAVGFIPAIFSIAFYLPQLFAANHAQSMKRKLPFVMFVGGVFERIPYVLIGFSVLIFSEESPLLALVLFFFFIGMGAFGAGVATPAWFTMIGKVLPVHRRGIFFGVSEGLGTMMGILGAIFVGITLEQVAYPLNFTTLFLIASIFMGISWIGLALNREPESQIVKTQLPLRHYFRQLPVILRDNHNYRRYIISYSISRLSTMAIGFFIVFGNENFNLSGTDVGILTAVLIGSQAIMQLIFGWLGDKRGHKLNLIVSAFALATAGVMALIATDTITLLTVFIFLGMAIASDNISRFSIILEFAVPEDHPTFIGLTNTLLVPVTFLGPIIAGVIATTVGFQIMFMIATGFGIIGGMLMLFWVSEPRHTIPQPIDSYDDIGD
jgi:MFS family permease